MDCVIELIGLFFVAINSIRGKNQPRDFFGRRGFFFCMPIESNNTAEHRFLDRGCNAIKSFHGGAPIRRLDASKKRFARSRIGKKLVAIVVNGPLRAEYIANSTIPRIYGDILQERTTRIFCSCVITMARGAAARLRYSSNEDIGVVTTMVTNIYGRDIM